MQTPQDKLGPAPNSVIGLQLREVANQLYSIATKSCSPHDRSTVALLLHVAGVINATASRLADDGM